MIRKLLFILLLLGSVQDASVLVGMESEDGLLTITDGS